MKVHVLHENGEWLPPFAEALDAEGVPWEPWFLDGGVVDLSTPPPEGVFYSRMSASSHTRGHARAKEHTRAVLSWLEAWGRRVVNGRRVLELEMSKVDQLTALAAAGLEVPRTVAVVGSDRLVDQARRFPGPFITKHNQGGKGLGVARFDHAGALAQALAGGGLEEPPTTPGCCRSTSSPPAGSSRVSRSSAGRSSTPWPPIRATASRRPTAAKSATT